MVSCFNLYKEGNKIKSKYSQYFTVKMCCPIFVLLYISCVLFMFIGLSYPMHKGKANTGQTMKVFQSSSLKARSQRVSLYKQLQLIKDTCGFLFAVKGSEEEKNHCQFLTR